MSENNKCYAIDASDIYELEDKLNEFYKGRDIISTKIFKTESGYDSLTYYKDKPIENVMDKSNFKQDSQKQPKYDSNLASEKQIDLIKRLGYKGEIENLTKMEAKVLIPKLLSEKEKKKSQPEEDEEGCY